MRLTVYFPENSPTTHEFVESKLTVGRLGDNDVQLDEGSVSSHHAEIEAGEAGAILRDLGSTNGTFLNGEQVSGETGLSEGDEIYFGGVRTVFTAAEGPEAAAEAPAPAGGSETAPAVAAAGTGRPDNFTYMSPLPRPAQRRDTTALVAWACAGAGLLAAIYALWAIVTV
jgi:predicted component of type VI protein secretion system